MSIVTICEYFFMSWIPAASSSDCQSLSAAFCSEGKKGLDYIVLY